MSDLRIHKLLKSLNAKDLNRFSKFIDSPYFNRKESVKSLNLLLSQNIREGQAALPEKEEIWTSINPDLEYNDLKFRKLCNDLIDRFERFLITEELQADPLLGANLLLNSIKEKKLESLAEKHINKSQVFMDRSVDRSADFFLQKYFFEKTLHHLQSNYEKKADRKKASDSQNYNYLTDNLDAFYVIEKLRHACDVLTWKKIYKIEAEVDVEHAIALIKNNKLGSIPAVSMYHLMFLLLSEAGSHDDYLSLRSLAFSNIELFPFNERREIFDSLLTFCIKDINKGGKAYYVDLLELYDWGIDTEIIQENGYLSPTTFRNYMIAGLRFGAFSEVEKFIHSRSVLLQDKHRDNAVQFNLARLKFYKKDYSSVVGHLAQVNYDDVWYNVNSRSLLLAAYYELQEYDVMESTLDSFSTYLRREKSLETNKRLVYSRFNFYLKKIHRSKEKAGLEKIKEALIAERLVNNKGWLLEKIDELL